jgi:hypothetical protein
VHGQHTEGRLQIASNAVPYVVLDISSTEADSSPSGEAGDSALVTALMAARDGQAAIALEDADASAQAESSMDSAPGRADPRYVDQSACWLLLPPAAAASMMRSQSAWTTNLPDGPAFPTSACLIVVVASAEVRVPDMLSGEACSHGRLSTAFAYLHRFACKVPDVQHTQSCSPEFA